MNNSNSLEQNKIDHLASMAKGALGACPIIGSLLSEAIGYLLPNQRFDRAVEFIRAIEIVVTEDRERLNKLEDNLKTPEGLDIFEEGLLQTVRSVSSERKERLARLVGKSLTTEELKYAESKKILNLYRELTDPEIIWLLFYASRPSLNSGRHPLMEKHPEILYPASRALNVEQKEIDRAALQDSYKNTLLRLGLIQEQNRSYTLTTLGRLLIRYITDGEYEEDSWVSG